MDMRGVSVGVGVGVGGVGGVGGEDGAGGVQQHRAQPVHSTSDVGVVNHEISTAKKNMLEKRKLNRKNAFDAYQTQWTQDELVEMSKVRNKALQHYKGQIGRGNVPECSHTCPKGSLGKTTGTSAYDVDVSKNSARKDEVCNCMNTGDASSHPCKQLLWFDKDDCPFTKFEKVMDYRLAWSNPVIFVSTQASMSNFMNVVSDHTGCPWHSFWHAVSCHAKTPKYAGMPPVSIQIPTDKEIVNAHLFPFVQYILALNAMKNYQVVDGKPVSCQVNTLIEENARKVRNSLEFLKEPHNPWLGRQNYDVFVHLKHSMPSNEKTLLHLIETEEKTMRHIVTEEVFNSIYTLFALQETATELTQKMKQSRAEQHKKITQLQLPSPPPAALQLAQTVQVPLQQQQQQQQPQTLPTFQELRLQPHMQQMHLYLEQLQNNSQAAASNAPQGGSAVQDAPHTPQVLQVQAASQDLGILEKELRNHELFMQQQHQKLASDQLQFFAQQVQAAKQMQAHHQELVNRVKINKEQQERIQAEHDHAVQEKERERVAQENEHRERMRAQLLAQEQQRVQTEQHNCKMQELAKQQQHQRDLQVIAQKQRRQDELRQQREHQQREIEQQRTVDAVHSLLSLNMPTRHASRDKHAARR